MKTVSVTQKESKFIEALITYLYAEPGFSDVGIEDIHDSTGMEINECKGVLGSLTKKRLVDVYEPNDDFAGIIHLRESLWHMHPEWKDYPTNGVEKVQLLNKN